MIILLFLICLIDISYCCYTSIIRYNTSSIYIPTFTLIPTQTEYCYSQTITSYIYPDSCDGSSRNQGYKCNIKTVYPSKTLCNTTPTSYVSSYTSTSFSITSQTYVYKLNCKNKTYSSLINIKK